MTAVEWLEDQYIKHSGNLLEMGKSFEQAKEMENKQIINCFIDVSTQLLTNNSESSESLSEKLKEVAEQYYNENFKSK